MADTSLDQMRFIGQVRDAPRAQRYATIATRSVYREKVFNGTAGVVTSKYCISGVKLVWDVYDDDFPESNPGEITNKLSNLSGSEDIETLEIFADEVVIRSPLDLPQTDVFIYARKLVFERDGRITTTPRAHQGQPRALARDVKDRPMVDGQVQGAPGLDGIKGGSVWLLLEEDPIVPDEAQRFFLAGSSGQDGEPGDYLDYVPKERQHALPGDTNGIAVQSAASVLSQFKEADWRWPADWKNDLAKNRVYCVRITWWDDDVIPALMRAKPTGTIIVGQEEWPGGVPNAYPSGMPGAAGDGGVLWSTRLNAKSSAGPKPLKDLLDNTPGRAGISPSVRAREPGTRTDAGSRPAFLDMTIVKHSLIESPRQPSKKITTCPFPITTGKGQPGDMTRAPGKPAQFQQLVPGNVGQDLPERVASQLGLGENAWLAVSAVESVLRYARDAHLNGHRELALSILAPYQVALSKPNLTAEQQGKRTEIDALVTQMNGGLDFYGNPPGWLPRLSLATNLQLFMDDQRNAVALLYYAYKLGNDWEKVQDQAQLLKSTSQTLGEEVRLAHSRMKQGLRLLEVSRAELTEVEQRAHDMKDQLQLLNDDIERNAEDKAREQVVFSGVCSLAAGICKVIPVGQPYLGELGGGAFQLAAKIDINDPLAAEEAFTFAAGFGTELDKFLSGNKDVIVSDSTSSITQDLERVQGATQATLDEITKINDKIASDFDAKTAERRAELQKQIDHLESEAKTLTGPEQETAQLKQRTFKQELALYKAGKLEASVTELRKKLKKVDLSDEDKVKRAALAKQLEGLEADKKKQQDSSAALTKSQSDHAKFVNEALERTKSVGAGISTCATALAQLVTPVDENHPKVKEIKEQIAQSKQYKGRFESLMARLREDTARKEKLLEGLARAQHQVSEASATIASNLTKMVVLGRQLRQTSAALDLDVKLYAKSLQERASARLQSSLYHFVKAYEYHHLKRLPSDFFHTDVIDAIRKLEEEKKKDVLGDAEFANIYQTVFKDKFSKLGDEIVLALQHLKPTMENKYVCTLTPVHLERLNAEWRLQFNLISTFQKGSWNDFGSRIIAVALKDISVEQDGDYVSLDLQFTHSGKHSILSRDGYRYCFAIGKSPMVSQSGNQEEVRWVNDDPIAWRMVYNAGETDKANRVTLDEQSQDEQLVAFLLREYKDRPKDAPIFKEHRPGYSSDLTLTIDGGLNLNDPADAERKANKPFSIDKLSFYVFFERQ